MTRTFSLLAVAAVVLWLPTQLYAGGPPRLCLPIDGVTADNATSAAELLTGKLTGKFWTSPSELSGIEFEQRGEQWYMSLYMKEDVRLRDVETALRDSKLTVPRERLQVFGHVILEIEPGKATTDEVVSALKKIDQAAVGKTETKDGMLSVTVDMPYPVYRSGNSHRDTVATDRFARNELSSEPVTRDKSPITAQKLPSYRAFRDQLAKHGAALKDIRWATEYACRGVGAVAVPDRDATRSQASR